MLEKIYFQTHIRSYSFDLKGNQSCKDKNDERIRIHIM